MFAEMAGYHHPQCPHWYLPTIGVEPHFHGEGFGSRLLTETLKQCDQEHMLAYLESSNPANTALYQRFSFERLGVIRVGHAAPMVPIYAAHDDRCLPKAALPEVRSLRCSNRITRCVGLGALVLSQPGYFRTHGSQGLA